MRPAGGGCQIMATVELLSVVTKLIIPGSSMKQKNNRIANNHNTNSRDTKI
jgi:hypothetical protein